MSSSCTSRDSPAFPCGNIRLVVAPAWLAFAVSRDLWRSPRRGAGRPVSGCTRGRAFYYPYLMLALVPLSLLQVARQRSGVINFGLRRRD
jgi:hypothetical protein